MSFSPTGPCFRTELYLVFTIPILGKLKVERLYGQRFKTRRQAKYEIIAWLLWYNHARLHLTLAYVSPVQFEQNWLATQPKQANS